MLKLDVRDIESVRLGDKHYRGWVGQPYEFDYISTHQLDVLVRNGLREYHRVVDIGCGSLRLGRLLIPWLRPGGYVGVEPEEWLVEEGIANELGNEIFTLKQAVVHFNRDFEFAGYGPFDYAVAFSIFTHTSEEQLKRCLKEVSLALVNGGIFLATYLEGGNLGNKEWVAPGCVFFEKQHIDRWASEVGLRCEALGIKAPNTQDWLKFKKGEL